MADIVHRKMLLLHTTARSTYKVLIQGIFLQFLAAWGNTTDPQKQLSLYTINYSNFIHNFYFSSMQTGTADVWQSQENKHNMSLLEVQ